MRAVAGPGRWIWVLSGLVTAAVLVIPGARHGFQNHEDVVARAIVRWTQTRCR